MAVETFVWEPDDEAGGDSTFRTRESKFGDGYVQVSSDGPNAEEDTWSLSFGGTGSEIKPIVDFIRDHKGARAFLWTPPDESLGLYRCSAFRRQTKPGGLAVLTVTFERAYHP